MQLAFDAPGKALYEIFVSMLESANAIGTMLAAIGVSKLYRIESTYPIRERLGQIVTRCIVCRYWSRKRSCGSGTSIRNA